MRALGNQSSVKVASKQQNQSNQIIMKAIARKYPEASHIVITTQPRTIGNKKSIFLVTPNCFRSLLSCLDFMSLFKIMQTRRDYRWDISTKGIGYQPTLYWVHKEIRKHMKQILLKHGGLRSTVERRNFWMYRTKINILRRTYGRNLYSKLLD